MSVLALFLIVVIAHSPRGSVAPLTVAPRYRWLDARGRRARAIMNALQRTEHSAAGGLLS